MNVSFENVLDRLDIISIIKNMIDENMIDENMIDMITIDVITTDEIMIIEITVTMTKKETIENTIEANAIIVGIMTKAVIVIITTENMINDGTMDTEASVIHEMRTGGQDKKSVLLNGLDQGAKTILFGIIDGRLWKCRKRLTLR